MALWVSALPLKKELLWASDSQDRSVLYRVGLCDVSMATRILKRTEKAGEYILKLILKSKKSLTNQNSAYCQQDGII